MYRMLIKYKVKEQTQREGYKVEHLKKNINCAGSGLDLLPH